MVRRIALVGDYSDAVVAHRAIPQALQPAQRAAAAPFTWHWLPTETLRDPTEDVAPYAAVWVVPGSPYRNTDGVLGAIRFARETRRPLLGSCGGFQHALLEFARDVAGIAEADHGETNPNGEALVIHPLACALAEAHEDVRLSPDCILHRAYGADRARGEYHCRFGVNPRYRATLEQAGLRFTAVDRAGEVRAFELPTAIHPFFVGTLFQSERLALRGELPPLAAAFVAAIS